MAGKRFHFGEWLRLELSDRGLEINKAAARIGVDESTLHRWMSQAGYNVRRSARGRLAALLQLDVRRINFLIEAGAKGLSVDVLNDEAGREVDEHDNFDDRSVEPYGEQSLRADPPTFEISIAAGDWVEITDNEYNGQRVTPAQIAQGLFRVRIRGDSMEPRFEDGALIEFKLLRTDAGRPDLAAMAEGQPYYVQLSDGRHTFKLLESREAKQLTLRAINKRYRKALHAPVEEIVRVGSYQFKLSR